MWAGCSIVALYPEDARHPALSRHIVTYSSVLLSSSLPTILQCPIHPPVFPQTPWPDNWDAYSNSLYIVFPLYRVGSGLVEMVVGTTRKPSSLEVNFVTLFMFCKTDRFL